MPAIELTENECKLFHDALEYFIEAGGINMYPQSILEVVNAHKKLEPYL